MICVSCDVYVYHLWFVCVFLLSGVFLSSRVTGACPVTTELTMRVNVRTTTTTTTTMVYNGYYFVILEKKMRCLRPWLVSVTTWSKKNEILTVLFSPRY